MVRLLAALGQAAFCAIGPERLRARSLLNKLAPAHTRDLTRSLIVVNMVWEGRCHLSSDVDLSDLA